MCWNRPFVNSIRTCSLNVGGPLKGSWGKVLNSDAALHDGSGGGNFGDLSIFPFPIHGRPFTLNMIIPSLGVVALQPDTHSVR